MKKFFKPLFSKRPIPSGKLIDVNGFKYHLHCTGPDDGRNKKDILTVVIEAGAGWFVPMYYWLQEKLSVRVKVCTYDRAGLGWSEVSKQPRDAEHIATQLHTLLHTAGVKGPYIFAGHSMGGLYLRVYADKYPQDMAGVALLDASHPRQREVFSDLSLPYRMRLYRTRLLYQSASLCANMGFTALYNPLIDLNDNTFQHLPQVSIQQLNYFSHQSRTYRSAIAESDSFPICAEQALQAGDFGDLPLVVLTASERVKSPYVDDEKYTSDWLMLQQELATLSTRGRHNVIEGASHGSIITNKQYVDQVAEEILELSLMGHKKLYPLTAK